MSRIKYLKYLALFGAIICAFQCKDEEAPPCPLPVADFTPNSPLEIGKSIYFKNLSNLNANGETSSFLWDSGNGSSSTQQNPTFTFNSTGVYTVTLIANTSCGSDTVSKMVTLTMQSTYPFMITIPATNPTFLMGCLGPLGFCNINEVPIHEVYLGAYEISETEVTQAQWNVIMGPLGIDNPSYFNNNLQNPVENVSWYDAVVYCNRISELHGLLPCYYSNYDANTNTYSEIFGKSGNTWSLPGSLNVKAYLNPTAKGYRLPTEAEWERAARGGVDNQVYSGSNDINAVAWYMGESGGKSWPVKTGKSPNQFGLYDMSGNVSEWCYNWYKEDYSDDDPVNPTGPATGGSNKMVRGGSWYLSPGFCRVANRSFYNPDYNNYYIGFRLARTP